MRGSTHSDLTGKIPMKFQFTPLHERQLVSSHGSASHELFQFTPLHERQQHLFDVYSVHVLFQFTPLHERQQRWCVNDISKIFYFNSRLYMRGSSKRNRIHSDQSYFNSRLYMRGSLLPLLQSLFQKYFNSRLYMRGSRDPLIVATFSTLFQFTPLHERQLQKYTIFSIKSTQFSTKPCFFIVTSRKVVLFSIPVQYFL